MSYKHIQIGGIGTIRFVKSERAKHINITVKSFQNVKVTVPIGVSFAEAERVVNNKLSWIRKHQARMRKVEKEPLIFNESTEFSTKQHRLIISKTNSDKITAKISGGKINMFYPKYLDVGHKSVQHFIRRVIEEALRMEAKQHIPARVKELALKYGFTYNKVFIKNIKSRWGSCSKKGNLNFSLHLMCLPYELIDYLILHELAHTVEHNHSKKYWAVLDNIYGNAKAVDKKLKQYRIGI